MLFLLSFAAFSVIIKQMKVVKRLKKITAFAGAALVFSAFAFAGCNGATYSFYTNIPLGGYEITEPSFKLGGEIAGYTQPEREEGGETDTSAFKGKGTGFSSLFTEAELVVYADFEAEGETAKFTKFAKDVGATLDIISKAVSATVTDSDIYRFNNAEAGTKIQISQTAYEVIEKALAVYEFTEGYYNPALYYNIIAYGFSSAESYPQTAEDLPADELIAKYTDLASRFGDIILDNEGGYFVTKPAYTVDVNGEALSLKLDLGGIAKGYAVDRVDELFDVYGYEYGYFNFGSSSMLVKKYPGEDFNIGLINPRSVKRDGYLKIKTSDEKFSTSGDYEQYYRIDGTRYCHIIDPMTGKPVRTGIMSVTVIGGSAAEDDALTTAIMAMGKDKAVRFIEEKLTDKKVVFTVE